MTDNSCVILGVSRSLALTLHFFPRWGNYANMTSVDFAWVVCLNMLSFVAHIHVLFLPALFRVEANFNRHSNLINYDTILFGILRLFGILFTHARVGNTHCYGHRRHASRSLFGHAPFMDNPLFSQPISMSHRPNPTSN